MLYKSRGTTFGEKRNLRMDRRRKREKEMKNIVNFSVAFSAFGLLTVATSADIIQSESFENYSVGSGQYVSETLEDHWLSNYDDHTVTGDTWDVWFTGTGGVGLSDGDFFGVTSYTGAVGAFTDGAQGYQMSDVDGTATMFFGAVEGTTSISFDMFVASTGWEAADFIEISFGGEVVFSTAGLDIDDLGIEGEWQNMVFEGQGELSISFASNSGSEAMYLDNMNWYGTAIPAPGAIALLGLAGIARRRRV